MPQRNMYVWITIVSGQGESLETAYIGVGKNVEHARQKIIKNYWPSFLQNPPEDEGNKLRLREDFEEYFWVKESQTKQYGGLQHGRSWRQ